MRDPTNTYPKLVLAWEQVAYHESPEEDTAALWCMTADGRIYTTGHRKRTSYNKTHFAVPGDVWSLTDALPRGPYSYFIGRYAVPPEILRLGGQPQVN